VGDVLISRAPVRRRYAKDVRDKVRVPLRDAVDDDASPIVSA